MNKSEPSKKSIDLGSMHFILEEEEGDLRVRMIVGVVLGSSEIDDRYIVDFYFKRESLEQKDRASDEIKFHLNFDSWDDVIYWVHEVPLKVCLLIFVKNEWGTEYAITDPKTLERVSFLIEYVESQLPDVKAHIKMLREIPNFPEDVIETNKLH